MNQHNRELACHHIELQDGCEWCGIYKQQSVRQCDRCGGQIHTDMVFLSLRRAEPQLICIYCNHDDEKWGS